MFMGYFTCGSSEAISSTPTNIQDITYISISNGVYDELFGSDKADIEMSSSSKIWDYDTRFYAKFQGNLLAGNVDYVASMVSAVRIKRRKNDDHKWFTLAEIPIKTNEDFIFEIRDRYAQGSQDYYYAMIPVIEQIEGNINKNSITSKFSNYFILDKDISYQIIFNTSLSVELNKNVSVVNTLGKKYPFVISNGISKYKTGTLQFSLAQIVDCDIGWNNGYNGYNYRTQFEEWIMNGQPKILKDWTGQIFMVKITSSIPIEYTHYDLPSYQIQFTEIGDSNSENDMYYNNFIDIVTNLKLS